MRFSLRSKASIILSLVAIVALVATALIVTNWHGTTPQVHAASIPTFHGQAATGTRVSTGAPLVKNRNMPSPVIHTKRTLGDHLLSAAKTRTLGASTTDPNGVVEGTVLKNFNGLTDYNQAFANGGFGFEVTPPDQGLCVGVDPGVKGEVVFETINSAIIETSTSGGALTGTPLLNNFTFNFAAFWEPNAFSDPRCFYDASTKTFFFTVIGFVGGTGPNANDTTTDIAVFNKNGFAVYQIDTTLGLGPNEFGDQPHVGYDNNNLYISTDEFNDNTAYDGAAVFIVSKADLVAEAATLHAVAFGPLSINGVPVLTIEPEISTSPNTAGYMLNSFSITDNQTNPLASSKQLGLWKVGNSGNVSSNPGSVTLSVQLINTEQYVFPVPAVSTGNGTVNSHDEESEPALNANDDRLLQVQFIDGHLWAALTTAVSIKGDPIQRDGIAWFEVNPTAGNVTQQGYITSKGNYLIFPAIMRTREETTAIVFTITGPKLNPSAAITVRKADTASFNGIRIVAKGAGPHLSFSDTLPPDIARPRWGDYSAAAVDVNGLDIWLATEYIPAATQANLDPFDNWGTRIIEVAGAR